MNLFTFVSKVVVPLKSFLWGGGHIARLHILPKGPMENISHDPQRPSTAIEVQKNIMIKVGFPDDWWIQDVPTQKGPPSRWGRWGGSSWGLHTY